MATSATRSRMEQMLESLKNQEEKPKEFPPPPLPYRPLSKARLPSSVGRSSDSSAHGVARVSLESAGRKMDGVRVSLESAGRKMDEARVSLESAGLKMDEDRVSLESAESKPVLVQVPPSRTEAGFLSDSEIGEEKISVKISNGVEKLNVFAYADIRIGSESCVQESELTDLQNRLLAVDATLREKEDENAVLRQRLQQYETRWIEFEAKMSSMEETWEKQMLSLQTRLAAATKKSLAADEVLIQQMKYDESTLRANQTEANLNPNGLQKLKSRLQIWKKAFKVRLHETKTTLQKIGNTEPSEKAGRKWLAKRIRRLSQCARIQT